MKTKNPPTQKQLTAIKRRNAFLTNVGLYKGQIAKLPNNPNYYALENGTIYSYQAARFLATDIKHRSGYFFLSTKLLNEQGQSKQRLVHSIIAEAFLGKCPKGLEISHLDHNKSNNAVSNLKYTTRLENMRQSWQEGRMANVIKSSRERVGQRNGKSKLTDDSKRFIFSTLKGVLTTTQIARYYDVSYNCIHSLFSGRTNQDFLKEVAA